MVAKLTFMIDLCQKILRFVKIYLYLHTFSGIWVTFPPQDGEAQVVKLVDTLL